MNNNMDKSLLFFTLSAVCVWLIVDVALGKNYLGNFLGTIFPFMSDGETTPRGSMTTSQVVEAQKNAPESSAIGSNTAQYGDNRANGNYSTNGQIVGDSYRKN